jgi:RNA polymerase sigma-70 factor, ECF subfamily
LARIINFFQSRASREQRFNGLVRPHLDSLYRMGYRLTRSREDAEDLVQETLARVIDRAGEMERLEKLRPWLVKILYRCFVDHFRKQKRSPVQNESDWGSEGALLDDLIREHQEDDHAVRCFELQRDLNQAMASLNPDQLDVLLLHDVEGYSAAETATILEISIGTVKSRLHRTRQQLKKILEPGTF